MTPFNLERGPTTPQITLHYFHGRGTGEPIRLVLAIGELPFDDRRDSVDEYGSQADLKARLPFAQMPALEVDGVFIGQTDSIARLAGLYPSDPIDAARSDMIVVYQAEIQSAIAKRIFDGVPGAKGTQEYPGDEKQRRIGGFFRHTLPGYMERLERLAQRDAMVGSALSWADVCVYNRLNMLLDRDDAVLDGNFPKLRAIFERVDTLPQVQRWIRAHKDDYPRSEARRA